MKKLWEGNIWEIDEMQDWLKANNIIIEIRSTNKKPVDKRVADFVGNSIFTNLLLNQCGGFKQIIKNLPDYRKLKRDK